MSINILLAGVGGQGIILASKLIAQVAIDEGHFVRTSETIGMAQRGGCVVSHVKIDGEKASPVNHLGGVDVMIAFEPAEALRNYKYMKPNGKIIVSMTPIVPATAIWFGGYNEKNIKEALMDLPYEVVGVNGQKLCKVVGNAKLLNVILLGVAIAEGGLPFSKQQMEQVLTTYLPVRWLESNQKALEVGIKYQQYR